MGGIYAMASPLNIVLVEDHDDLRMVTCAFLKEQGHQVLGLSCAEELIESPIPSCVDVYVLDINLPGEDGLSLARRLRNVQPNAGIIMTTARDEVKDKVIGYDSGADIYLAKPVDPAELLSTIAALGRRLQGVRNVDAPPEVFAMALDVQRRLLSTSKDETRLTHSEVTLLSAMLRSPGKITHYWQLMELLELGQNEQSKSNLEVRIVRLREKIMALGEPRSCIRSIRGSGYELCVSIALK